MKLIRIVYQQFSRDMMQGIPPGNPSSETLQGHPSPGKTHLFFNYVFSENVVFGLQTAFFDGFNVLLSFLAEE